MFQRFIEQVKDLTLLYERDYFWMNKLNTPYKTEQIDLSPRKPILNNNSLTIMGTFTEIC